MRRSFGPFRFLSVVAIGLAGSMSSIAAPAAETNEPPAPVDLLWGVRIPLRDGVELAATVLKPKPQAQPLPVIFTLTPYIADSYLDRALYFARHGYVFALVDVRGRGGSGGSFEPFANEGRDGHDVVEWLARQPWCNGKVAMWGGSYAGFDQWSAAKEFPPHLTTIVPAAAAHPGVDFPFQKNVYYPYDLRWLTFTSGTTPNRNLFGDEAFWIDKYRELYLARRPFRELEAVVGNGSTVFQKWLAHPTPDAYWDAMAPSDADYGRLQLPILSITGHYDGDQPGALEFYKRHLRHGVPKVTERHFLILGPWDHAGTRTPNADVGGLTFGPASLVDLNDLHRQWYDWTMKDGPRPKFLEKRVAYYVVGAEEWRYADTLESVAGKRRTLHLASAGGRANDVFHSGTLVEEPPPGTTEPDRWTYDPLDVTPAELERAPVDHNLTDQRYALNLYGAGVVYHSAPLTADTVVAGSPELTVWMSLDVPDTDFQASLYEIQSDGRSVLLSEDVLRARYRESPRQERLVTPGAVERYTFSGFTWFARRLSKGSRLRLVLRSPNTTNLQKNWNGGGVVADEGAAQARTAHVTLYHDAERPSALVLPIVD